MDPNLKAIFDQNDGKALSSEHSWRVVDDGRVKEEDETDFGMLNEYCSVLTNAFRNTATVESNFCYLVWKRMSIASIQLIFPLNMTCTLSSLTIFRAYNASHVCQRVFLAVSMVLIWLPKENQKYLSKAAKIELYSASLGSAEYKKAWW